MNRLYFDSITKIGVDINLWPYVYFLCQFTKATSPQVIANSKIPSTFMLSAIASRGRLLLGPRNCLDFFTGGKKRRKAGMLGNLFLTDTETFIALFSLSL